MVRHRFTALVAAASLVPVGLSVTSVASAGTPTAQAGTSLMSAQPAAKQGGGAKYVATVRETKHGIPHIMARNFGSPGFGSGYSAADSSICTLADTLVTARGQRSRWFGPTDNYNDQVTLDAPNLQVDAFVTDLHNRKVVEKLLADPKAGPGHQGG